VGGCSGEAVRIVIFAVTVVGLGVGLVWCCESDLACARPMLQFFAYVLVVLGETVVTLAWCCV
jgi:hypothetical protein